MRAKNERIGGSPSRVTRRVATLSYTSVSRMLSICGSNDASAIHKTRAGIRPAALSLPARYIHSPAASVRLSDLENTLALLKILSRELCEL